MTEQKHDHYILVQTEASLVLTSICSNHGY